MAYRRLEGQRGAARPIFGSADSVGDTVEFWFSQNRDPLAAKRFPRKALSRHGRSEHIVVDGSQANQEAIVACDAKNRLSDRSPRVLVPIRIRQSQYLNNRIEQDHRRIKRRVRLIQSFKSFNTVVATMGGVEMVHMMRKRQGRVAFNPAP